MTEVRRFKDDPETEELSRAIVAFLQRGVAKSPRAERAAAAAQATRSEPAVLVAQVEQIVQETLDVSVDWGSMNLGEAGRAAAAEIGRRHPGLTADALDALAWNFTFAWR